VYDTLVFQPILNLIVWGYSLSHNVVLAVLLTGVLFRLVLQPFYLAWDIVTRRGIKKELSNFGRWLFWPQWFIIYPLFQALSTDFH